jgi:hypothetical protein
MTPSWIPKIICPKKSASVRFIIMPVKISNTIWRRVFWHRTVSRDCGAVRRSLFLLNFGQHYPIISARFLDADLSIPGIRHNPGDGNGDSSRTLSGHCYGAKLDPQITCPKDRPKLWHNVSRN